MKTLELLMCLILSLFVSPAFAFDYPMFRIARNGEFVGTLVGTIHYLLSPTAAPKRLARVIKDETDLFVLESDMRKDSIEINRRNFLPKLRSECGVYALSSKEDQDFLDDLAKTTPGIDPARAKTFVLGDWRQVVSARTTMAGGNFNGKSLYEGVEAIIYRMADLPDMRFLETIEELTRNSDCLDKRTMEQTISGFRRLMQCVPCQREKSREDLGYFLLDRKNWRQEAEKMLSAPLRYYGVDDTWQMRGRNRAWADRFVELTKEKQRLTTFVGVAHLVGEGSFIEELEKKGFTVTEIPWTDQDE